MRMRMRAGWRDEPADSATPIFGFGFFFLMFIFWMALQYVSNIGHRSSFWNGHGIGSQAQHCSIPLY